MCVSELRNVITIYPFSNFFFHIVFSIFWNFRTFFFYIPYVINSQFLHRLNWYLFELNIPTFKVYTRMKPYQNIFKFGVIFLRREPRSPPLCRILNKVCSLSIGLSDFGWELSLWCGEIDSNHKTRSPLPTQERFWVVIDAADQRFPLEIR